MKRTFALSVTAWAFACGLAAAQQSSAPADASLHFSIKDTAPTPEEVEIFRRILDRSLQSWKVNGSWWGVFRTTDGSVANRFSAADRLLIASVWDNALLQNPAWLNEYGRADRQTPELPGPEGTYLKGYGVVFTITLPWDGQNPIGAPAKATAKPQSEWEKVRKELRGEKTEPEKQEAAKTPALAETVLKVLAENGRHFTQMAGNERVTVAVTLRPVAPSDLAYWYFDAAKGQRLPMAVLKGSQTSAQKQDFDKEYATKKQEALNYVRLGDLRTNEKRYQEAVDAYHKATRSYERMLELRWQAGNSSRDFLIDIGAASDVYNKLAQTLYALGENDKAQKILQAVAKAYERFAPKSAPKEKETPAKATLPGKLTVSATKQVLDQMGAGKMSFEEFRKAATVEYVPIRE